MSITIRTNASTLSFATRDTEHDNDIIYEPYPVKAGINIAANMRLAFGNSPLLALGHRRANVLMDTPVMLVPSEEFDETAAAQLYRQVNTVNSADGVMWKSLPGLNTVAVYAVNNDLQTVLADHFADVAYMPLMQPVWRHFFGISHDGLHRRLFCYMHDGRLELTAFRRDRFCLNSSMAVTTTDDAAYFILNTWQQLAMQQTADILVVAGTMPGRDRLMAELRRFISDIREADNHTARNNNGAPDGADIPFDLRLLFNTIR